MKLNFAQWGLSSGDDAIVPILSFKVRGFHVLCLLLFFVVCECRCLLVEVRGHSQCCPHLCHVWDTVYFATLHTRGFTGKLRDYTEREWTHIIAGEGCHFFQESWERIGTGGSQQQGSSFYSAHGVDFVSTLSSWLWCWFLNNSTGIMLLNNFSTLSCKLLVTIATRSDLKW